MEVRERAGDPGMSLTLSKITIKKCRLNVHCHDLLPSSVSFHVDLI